MATYKQAGVNIEVGDAFVRRIKSNVRSTFSKSVLTDIGAFGAFYDASFKQYKSPVLVSSTDGVGTKLKIAVMMNKHDTIGQDLVNHCVNDIAVCGATPLFFLDYFAVGKLKINVAEKVVSGLVKACKENNCSLVGGETAEMPGIYKKEDYDLAGTIVGVVERKNILTGKKVRAGDILIGLPSTGLHTKGYSLARIILLKKFSVDKYIPELQSSIGEALLAVHRSYLKPIQAVLQIEGVHALSHITGGGIIGNTKRVIPQSLNLSVAWNSWRRPAIFSLIQKVGKVPETDMQRTFNLGIGLIIIASKHFADNILSYLLRLNEKPFVIGIVEKK
ncbi:MAG: phosphoribosylformylglycinamidine cyclo-ligase [Ignavibacteriae bacterium]|nr:phosphoribosylformylglycinamidine cyclo-ligase [Ignavibacteriota bacterium]